MTLTTALIDVDKVLATLRRFKSFDAMTTARLREEMKLQMTYDANAIKGSRLTLRETVIVVQDRVTVGPGYPIQDLMAACGFAAGFDVIMRWVDCDLPLTVDRIKMLHRYVMLGALPHASGEFRTTKVCVEKSALNTSQPTDIPNKVQALVNWVNREKTLHPLIKASRFLATFLSIQPFADGNARMGLLLMNVILLRDGFDLVNIRHEDRTRYLDALKTFNDSGSIEPLAMLIAERALETVNYAIYIAKQKEAMRKGTILN